MDGRASLTLSATSVTMPGMRLFILALLASGLGGCVREPMICTLMDCSNGVSLRLGSPHERYAEEMPLRIEACVEEVCRTWILDKTPNLECRLQDEDLHVHCFRNANEQLSLQFHQKRTDESPVSVTIRSKDGATLFEGQETVKLEPFYPNGYECDKKNPCYSGSADFSSQYPQEG